jgi:hypothetical protein
VNRPLSPVSAFLLVLATVAALMLAVPVINNATKPETSTLFIDESACADAIWNAQMFIDGWDKYMAALESADMRELSAVSQQMYLLRDWFSADLYKCHDGPWSYISSGSD